MNVDTIFLAANGAVIPAWLLLAVLPRWRHTQRVALATAGIMAVTYAAMLVFNWGSGEGNMGSLDGVRSLFQNKNILLFAWIHYLVFDLFVGMWEVREANRLGISPWLMVPILFLTLMFGPVGFFLFLTLRAALRREVWIDG